MLINKLLAKTSVDDGRLTMLHWHHTLTLMTNWLHLHPGCSEIATFIIAFSESIAVIGLIIPGSLLLAGIGALVGSGVLAFGPTLISAILGAILGDTFSYAIGSYFSGNLLQIWPFRKYPHWLVRGQAFFSEHGGKSVFIGRFLGPLRPITPVIAGSLRMQPLKFLLATTLSGCTWAPAYMIPGILVGAASVAIPPGVITHAIILLFVMFAALWTLSWFIRKCLIVYATPINNFLQRTWLASADHAWLKPLRWLLVNEGNFAAIGQVGLASFGLVIGITFLGFAYAVKIHSGVLAFNLPIYHLCRSLHSPHLIFPMFLLSNAGNKQVLLPCLGLTALTCFWKKQRYLSYHVAGLAILSSGSIHVIKNFVQFQRPNLPIFWQDSYSFPSGHTTLAFSCYGFIAILVYLHRSRLAKPLLISAITLSVAIACSRLYMLAHWFTDIVGGILLACCILSVIFLSYRRQAFSKQQIKPLLVSFGLSWLLCFATVNLIHHKSLIKAYQHQRPAIRLSLTRWWLQNNPPVSLTTVTGKFARLGNIEWASSQDQIIGFLQQHDWKRIKPNKWRALRSHLDLLHHEKMQPVSFGTYDDTPPRLVFIKEQPELPMLVLVLWDSYIVMDNTIPLWYGSIFYYEPWIDRLRADQLNDRLPPAFGDLINSLTQQSKLQFKFANINKELLKIKP